MNTRHVSCPKCGREWVAYEGEGDMTCNCHMFCEDGSKPSDCSVTATTFTGQMAWPMGMHTGKPPGVVKADNPMLPYGYCSTHNKYILTSPVIIEVDWTANPPKKLRMTRHV